MDEVEELRQQVIQLTDLVKRLFTQQAEINQAHKEYIEELIQASNEHRSAILYLDKEIHNE